MTYNYTCDKCGKEYTEIRDITHPQWFTACDACGGTYVEAAE